MPATAAPTFFPAASGSPRTIKTLSLNMKASIRPSSKDHERAPDYRVHVGQVEIGAAWKKTSMEEATISVKLDDPSLPAPIYATLVAGEGSEFNLIWSR
jgi:uncharacterized protein (DUF736 family)